MIKKGFRFLYNWCKRFIKLCRSFYYFRNFHTYIHGKIYVGIRKNIRIGRYCSINQGAIIQGFNEVIIGNHVVLSVNSMLLDGNLDQRSMIKTGKRNHIAGFVHVGDYVWIGAGAIILPNVSIGDRSIIAAGAVVTESVPSDVLVAGNPAKILKKLHEDSQNKK